MNTTALAAVSTLLAFCNSVPAWDFEYGYQNVFAPNAEAYVFSQSNLEKVRNGPISYYTCTGIGQITYLFSFDQPVQDAFLAARMDSVYFPFQLSEISLRASTDGASWSELPLVPGSFLGAVYNDHLPEQLLGANQIWIQARLISDPSPGYALFSLADDRIAGDIFQFKATLVPEPSTVALALLGGVLAVALCRKSRT